MRDLPVRLREALERNGAPSSDFDLNRVRHPPAEPLREAAVLIAITEAGRVLLTKRASHLSQHPGQIAFPGGKIETFDAGPRAAALREAREEIGLSERAVEVLGELSPHRTVTGFGIAPVLALVRGRPDLRPEENEVSEIFDVPLAFLADPGNYSVQSRIWRGTERRYYAVPYGPYYIWGATACILRNLAERLA